MVDMLPGRGWANIDHFLPIMFRTSLLELRDAGITEIYPGSTASPWPRYCSWARLRHRGTGRDLMVFNTHQAPFQTIAIARIRSATVKWPVRAMRTADPGYRTPAVLAGDFNARADERRPIYSDHLRKLGADGWRDSARIARRDLSAVRGVSTRNGFGVKIGTWLYRQISTSGKDVDYLWVRPGATVPRPGDLHRAEVRRLRLPDGHTYPFFADGPVPSDHCPVLARVRFA